MKVGAVSFDFWETLYVHRGTPEARRRARIAAVAEAAARRGVPGAGSIGDTVFQRADAFIKAGWHGGAPPNRVAVLEHVREGLDGSLTRADAASLLAAVETAYTGPLKPQQVPGAREVLEAVAARWPTYLLSDTYTLSGRLLDVVLGIDGLRSLFRARFYSDELGVEKPDPAGIRLIAAREHVDVAAIVHVGDLWERDAELARRAGCRCVLVGPGARQRIEAEPPTTHLVGCESLTSVPEVLRGFD